MTIQIRMVEMAMKHIPKSAGRTVGTPMRSLISVEEYRWAGTSLMYSMLAVKHSMQIGGTGRGTWTDEDQFYFSNQQSYQYRY